MATIRFYAADLAAYNNGHLHGVWIDATSDADEMQEAVAAMLRASPCPNVTVEHPETGEQIPSAEEWLIHDYDDALGAISHLGETSDLQAIAEIMEAVESILDDHDETRAKVLIGWLSDHSSSPDQWASDLEDAFAGEWSDAEEYAADYWESTGELDKVPDGLRGYIDFQAVARDLSLGGDMDFICTSTGRHLQSYDDMRGRECIALHCH